MATWMRLQRKTDDLAEVVAGSVKAAIATGCQLDLVGYGSAPMQLVWLFFFLYTQFSHRSSCMQTQPISISSTLLYGAGHSGARHAHWMDFSIGAAGLKRWHL